MLLSPSAASALLLAIACAGCACGDDDDADGGGDADADVDADADTDADGDGDGDGDGDTDGDGDADGDADPDCAGIVPENGTDVRLEQVVDGLTRPLLLVSPPHDPHRMMVVGQRGEVWLIRDGALAGSLFLDATDRVMWNDGPDEVGLLGLVFHPDYDDGGRLFIYYTDANDGDQVLAELDAPGPDAADPDSEVELLRMPDPANNHNGGMLAFGPDGHLYVGTGDGGGVCDDAAPGAPQDTDSLLGKILRLDVSTPRTVRIPAGNPWNNEVWALGLRNPWRFSFDRATGDLYIGDNGQQYVEEIDFAAAGTGAGFNYGWPNLEAEECSNNFVSQCDWPCDVPAGNVYPLYSYTHDIGISVIGGYVYRGRAMPDVVGTYFFADWGIGEWFSLSPDDPDGTVQDLGFVDAPASFGEDACGELYVVSQTGAVHRVTLR